MDILGKLNDLRQYSFDETSKYEDQSNQLNPAEDYGLRGSKPNFPLNSMGGRRMAGHGIMGAIAGEVAPYLVEPARKILQPAFNNLISETFGVGLDVPQIASR